MDNSETPRHSGEPIIDRRLLRKLLREHEPRLARRIGRRLPRHHQALAGPEDILQEVWIAAFLRSTNGNWDSVSGFERWLTFVTTSKVDAWLRRLKTAKRGGSAAVVGSVDCDRESGVSPVDSLVAHEVSPSREAAAHEAADAIQAGIRCLPAIRRTVVSMRYIEGRSLAEIASACKISVSAVGHHLSRAIPQLRKELGSAGRFFTDADSSDDVVP